MQVTASSSIDTPTRFEIGPISSHDGEGKNIDNSGDDDLAGVHIVIQEGRNGHAIARMTANDINDMPTDGNTTRHPDIHPRETQVASNRIESTRPDSKLEHRIASILVQFLLHDGPSTFASRANTVCAPPPPSILMRYLPSIAVDVNRSPLSC